MSASPANVSELTAHLGFWLRYVSNYVSQAFALRLAANGVTAAEWVMMRALYDHDRIPPSRLASELGMTRGAITKLAQRLIGKSLIVRKADPDDGRAQTLALTSRGRKLLPAIAALADRNDAEFFDHLTADERRTLERILKRTVEHHRMTVLPTS
jgi:DNA-binding MarR family transcriptional regulator